MQSHVYTCTSFAIQLINIIRGHPTATGLRLQLLPPSTPLARAAAAAAATQATDGDNADFITVYAVLLASSVGPGSAGGGESLVAAYAVVGHVSSVSLQWCAQLQRALSLAALSTATTHAFERRGGRFCGLEPRRASGLGPGVTWFAAQLAPYVPPLQWSRDVDGILGSHHSVSVLFACAAPDAAAAAAAATAAATVGCDVDSDAGAADSGVADTDSSESCGSEAAAAAAVSPAMEAPHTAERCDPRPRRRARRDACGATPASPACLPLRVAVVLNGNVPLPAPRDGSAALAETCVLCLCAVDGVLLTAAPADDVNPPRPAHRPPPDAFGAACELLARDVVPRVSLRCIGGEWAREGASSPRLRSDVCHVRRRLGTSYAIQYPTRTSAPAHARSLVFVVDMSVPLASHLTASSPSGSHDTRCGIAMQVADAMTVTVAELVAQNPDVFASAGGRTGAEAGAAADVPPAGRSAASMTPEMLCHSIAESVRVLVGLSPHPGFAAEVERLLWEAGEGDSGGAASRPHRTAAELQERIEARLRRLLPS